MKKNYIGLFRYKRMVSNPKRNGWLMSVFAAATLLLGSYSYGQTNIANYTFTKSTSATYVPITGGTKLFPSGTNVSYDDEVSAAITLPSPFTFGGVAVTSIYVSTNGFITFGAAPSTTLYAPLSTSITSGTGVISAFGQDGGFSSVDTTQPPGNHEIRYQDLGTEFVVQWQDHANFQNRTQERLNFQIRLVYATNEVKIIYGNCTDPGTISTTTANITPQVGIRGNSTTYSTNVNSLMIGNVPVGTTCDWSKAVTGNSNSSTMLFSGITNVNIKIPNGLQYTWTPGTQLPVRTFTATTAITSNSATLNWTAPTGATSYNVQYRKIGDCDWINWNGNPAVTNTATLSGLDLGTNYQARVQALNGSAESIYSHIPNAAGTGDGYSLAGTFATLSNSTCTSTVTGLASSAITPNTATISWTASTAAPANGYEYYFSTSNAIPAYTVTPSGSTAAGIVTANLTGLNSSTVYYYWVRANCDGSNKGSWSNSGTFTTLGLCPTVTAPTAAATGVSVTPTITWTAISGVTGYKVNVGTTSGATDVVANADVPTGTSYVFATPLSNGTTYYYTVTAYTATSPAPAVPCTVRSFTTILSCPSTVTGLASSALTPNTATISWTASTTAPANGYEYYYSTSSTTPTVTTVPSGSTAAGVVTTGLSGLTPSTQYYYWVRTNCNGTDKGAWSSSANFTTLGLCPTVTAPTAGATGVSVTPTITWTAISGVSGYKINIGTTSGGTDVVANADATTNNYPVTAPLNNATTYYYSVTAYTATSTTPATPCTIRSFTTVLSCPSTVTGLTSSAVALDTATISWTASTTAPANGYEYYYSTSSTAPTATTAPSGSTPAGVITANLTLLTPSTQYYYWVRTNCNGTDKGAWSGSATFTTKCNATNVPYVLDFEGVTVPALPGCTSVINAGSGNAWTTEAGYTPFASTGKVLRYRWNTSSAANTWFYTQGINLVAGMSYTISYKYANSGSTFTEKLKVAYGTSADVAGMTTVLADYPSITNVQINSASVSFTPTASGIYYFGFQAYSDADKFYLMVDDINIDLTSNLATTEIAKVEDKPTVYPNPFADVLNISDIKNVKSIMISDMSGKIVKTIAKPESTLRLGDLNAGMYLVILNMNDGSRQIVKAIKK